MTAERHMVVIETEKTGRIELTPRQFDMLLQCAIVGLDGGPFEGEEADAADDLHDILIVAHKRHSS